MSVPSACFADREVNAVLALSDGSYYFGKGFGALGKSVGEICFNTSMTGYQEALTDPSYAGQIINFTTPHIGNVGCNADDFESVRAFCAGLVTRCYPSKPSNWRAEIGLHEWAVSQKLVGVAGPDTRALTRRIRDKGPLNAVLYHAAPGEYIDARALCLDAAALPSMTGKELAGEVTRRRETFWETGAYQFGHGYPKAKAKSLHVVALDYGIKDNILRCLSEAGIEATVVPAKTSFQDILRLKPDGLFLSNGPGDPAETAKYALSAINEALRIGFPVFGICLGHQLLALASGFVTEKMPAGHRGCNHPVKNVLNGKVEITSQNHGFCVSSKRVPGCAEITHISLFDGTVEGLRRKDVPAFSVQYHPESSPGPRDSAYLFDQFADMMRAAKRA